MRSKDIPVSGCSEDWDRMRVEGGGVRRYCDSCRTHVHDLSAMDERQARVFLQATQGIELCLAYTQDDDGAIVFADRAAAEPPSEAALVPISRLRRSGSAASSWIAAPTPGQLVQLAGAASVALLLGACTAHGDDEPILQITDDPQIQLETIPAPVLIPPQTPEAAPPPQPEPPEAEPCEPQVPKPPHVRPTTKGRKTVGILLPDSENPLD